MTLENAALVVVDVQSDIQPAHMPPKTPSTMRVTMVRGPGSQYRDGNHGTIAIHDSIGGGG